ncbi:hypothetical protein C8F01DRAFT_1373528 [Mycena amicta]|nr:hypothetical protein C8F01DRAFT_1373528 [Mycena amicta]
MTTPNSPQPSSASPLPVTRGWMKRLRLGSSRGSSLTPPGSSSESASVGAAADTPTAWLDSLLLVARRGVAESDAAPPAVKTVFGSVVLLLENVEKVQENQEALKDPCEKIVTTLEILQDVIQGQPGVASTAQLQEKCLAFQQLLNVISIKIEEIKKKQTSRRQRVKEFILPSGVTSAIAVYGRSIEDLQEQFKLFVVRKTELVLNEIPGGQIPQSGSSQSLAAYTITGTSWFSDTFNQELSRSQIEDALAGSITDVIQEIWNNLTNPIRATLNHTHNALEKVQALFNHLDAQFGNLFKINASSEEAIEMGYKQISLAKNLGDTAEDAQTWLRANQDEWLLLFDNTDKRDLDLGAYLPKCTHGNILITSRNPELWSHTGPDKKIIEISNLVVDDAVVLLLKCAGLNIDKHKTQAAAVVKELYCFPLAIIQAGAFISKIPSLHQDISNFISLYRENRAALLSKKPEQSQGDYNLTVYTTWEMSFKQLEPAAAEFLQLCSFIHFEGITEDIFKRASQYTPRNGPLDPSLDTLQPGLDLLSRFKNAESKWNSLAFGEMMSDICGYSLMTWQNNAYTIHPLVHQWSRTMAIDPIGQWKLVVSLLGMSAACSVEFMEEIQLVLHLVRLLEDGDLIDTRFEDDFGRVFQAGGMYRVTEALRRHVLTRSDQILGAEHPSTIRAKANLALTYRDLGWHTDAQRLGEQVLEQWTRLLGAEHPSTIVAAGILALIYRDLGQHADAQRLEEQVLEQRARLLGVEHPRTIQAKANLAVTYRHLGRHTDAQRLGEQVLEQQTRLLGAEHPDTIRAVGNLAVIYRDLGQHTATQRLEEQVLEQWTRLLGAEHPDTIRAAGNLALTYRDLGWYTDAQRLGEQVLEQRTRLLGAEHPDTILTAGNLAVTYRDLGWHTDAQRLGEQVLEQRTRLLGVEHPGTIQAKANLAMTYRDLGQHTDAQELQEQVLEQWTRLLGAEHPDTILTAGNLALTYRDLGRHKEAQRLGEQVLEQRTRLLGMEHPNTILATANLALIYQDLGRHTDAQRLGEQVLEQRTRLFGAEHPHTILAADNLAVTYQALRQLMDTQS